MWGCGVGLIRWSYNLFFLNPKFWILQSPLHKSSFQGILHLLSLLLMIKLHFFHLRCLQDRKHRWQKYSEILNSGSRWLANTGFRSVRWSFWRGHLVIRVRRGGLFFSILGFQLEKYLDMISEGVFTSQYWTRLSKIFISKYWGLRGWSSVLLHKFSLKV